MGGKKQSQRTGDRMSLHPNKQRDGKAGGPSATVTLPPRPSKADATPAHFHPAVVIKPG